MLAFQQLEQKQEHLRTAVMALCEGYDTGLFVWGEGGIGKSYIVDEALRTLKANFVLHNSRMTARGFVDRQEAHPTKIHWVEDAENLLADKNALGIIRSACWSQCSKRPPEREVTWGVHSKCGQPEIRFVFTGGILVISNTNLADSSPELRAVKTRVRVLNMDVSPAEFFARMKTISRDGYTFGDESLSPEECWQVASFIREKLDTLRQNLDLRLLKSGFHDFLMCKNAVMN